MADLAALLDALEADWEPTGDRSYLVRLPGVHKLKTNCNLIVEDHALRVEAFVVRHPEQDHERLWRLLLRRNAGMYGVSFAVDDHGDVYLMGRVPLSTIDEAELDRLLGAVLTYADEVFDTALEIGFADSIRREWRWRLSRGESTRNLAAFTHLRPTD
ncbi:putative sensory transduction regulator [Stackebrandtia albiflava]|uniref:Putative sensory transduction regulator n=1 Tax=Stackebrandtia albiflava TaxID=406432 RepID=A0A562UR98_9ACTN|nr:YbjN domain-containing protein [Stackebrandtia albiflava]TWJ08118.1 putative sensory transduction regulator [Stackebrandtia albiflava]